MIPQIEEVNPAYNSNLSEKLDNNKLFTNCKNIMKSQNMWSKCLNRELGKIVDKYEKKVK
jgi:hypothetical protein